MLVILSSQKASWIREMMFPVASRFLTNFIEKLLLKKWLKNEYSEAVTADGVCIAVGIQLRSPQTPSKIQLPGLLYGVLISCFLTLPKLLILWTDHLELHTKMNFSRLVIQRPKQKLCGWDSENSGINITGKLQSLKAILTEEKRQQEEVVLVRAS